MRRIIAGLVLVFLLLPAGALHASVRNVILILTDGVNQAQLELARQAGFRNAGMSDSAAMPVSGPLLPLPGDFERPVLAAKNALATGTGQDRMLGMTVSDEVLDSLLTQAKLQGRRTGFVTDGALNDWTGGVFFAHESQLPEPDKLADWLPLCDFDLLAGTLNRPQAPALDPLDAPMAKLGYALAKNRKQVREAAPDRRLFATHSLLESRLFAADRPKDSNESGLLDYMARALSWPQDARGMFLVVDCSKIRLAAATNDTAALIRELWMFDRVLGEAVAFYKEHPEDTLVVAVSLYDVGDLQLGREIGTDFPVGTTRASMLAKLNTSAMTFRQALELAGAGDLFAPGAEELRELERAYDVILAKPAPRDFRSWLNRVLNLRDRHAGVEWLTRAATISLTPVLAIGTGSEAFAGEYNAEELHRKLAAVLGLTARPE